MSAEKPKLLTTGQAAKLCSVTPDTILKWIKKDRLHGIRTAGGHYRIDRKDLEPFIVSSGQAERAVRQLPECDPQGLRCWEYLSHQGAIRDDCRQCVVYRVRAALCFLMAGLEADVGHACQFRRNSCDDCVYYRRVKGLATNVLVITSDDKFIERLAGEENKSITLRFAKSAYEASAIIHDFWPDLAVIDLESIPRGDTELITSLATDSRVPGLKITVVLPPGISGHKHLRPRNDLVVSVLEKPFGTRRLAAVISNFPVDSMT